MPGEAIINFNCGHESTGENVYRNGGYVRCRECKREGERDRYKRSPALRRRVRAQSRRWRKENPERWREHMRRKSAKNIKENRLQFLIYWQLRGLAIRDSMWFGRGRAS